MKQKELAIINFQISKDKKEKLIEIANSKDMTLSALLKMYIDKGIRAENRVK